MSQETILKSKVADFFTLVIDSEDGSEPKKWKLVYDYRAIAAIEDAIDRDIKKIEDWKDLSSGKHFPHIVYGGLRKYHPDVTLEQVLDILNPEAQRILSDKIFDLMFPGAKEAYEKFQKEQTTGATADPNASARTQSE